MNDTRTAIDIAQTTPRSSLVGGFNHVAQSTQDLDRLVAFYRDTMDIPFVELPDPRGRHGFLLLGGDASGGVGSVLHVFEVPAQVTEYGDPGTMFRRGRLDHIAVEAVDESALATLRERLIAAGASDGSVRIFGDWLLSVHVVDPDGMNLEVVCRRTGSVFTDDDVVAG